jgi:hypothetical protein
MSETNLSLGEFKDHPEQILPGGGNVPPPLYGIPNIPYSRARVVAGSALFAVVAFHGPFREFTRVVVDNTDCDVDLGLLGEGLDATEMIPIRKESIRALDFATPTNEDGTIKERIAFSVTRGQAATGNVATYIWVE